MVVVKDTLQADPAEMDSAEVVKEAAAEVEDTPPVAEVTLQPMVDINTNRIQSN